MAVYTLIDDHDRRHLYRHYFTTLTQATQAEWSNHTSDLFNLRIEPINAGYENSNYWVISQHFHGVLTLFEELSSEEVQDCFRLTHHLQQHGIPVPDPISDDQNQWLQRIQNKPAILCRKLSGSSVMAPQPEHCEQIGNALAKVHLYCQSLPQPPIQHPFVDYWQHFVEQIIDGLIDHQRGLLTSAMQEQQEAKGQIQELPVGWIHGDCFRDNVLFEDDQLSAILDWYSASQDSLLFDLAIVFQDWCVDNEGHVNTENYQALLSGYRQTRALTTEERRYWPLLCRAAALRFWISRLEAQQRLMRDTRENPKAPTVAIKDPGEFERKLQAAYQMEPL